MAELDMVALGAPEDRAGRVEPVDFVAPFESYILALGDLNAGRRVLLGSGDSIIARQTADFDATNIFRFRAITRGPSIMPVVFAVTAKVTSTYGVTIDGTLYEYVADTAGLSIGSGVAASIDAKAGDRVTVGGLTGIDESSVGRQLLTTGAAEGVNNGSFAIIGTAPNDPTVAIIRNSAAILPDANDGSISWTEARAPDNETTIMSGLRDAIHADASRVVNASFRENVLQLDPIDPDNDPPVVSVGANLISSGFWWVAKATIDGAVRWSEVILPNRDRDVFDAAILVKQVPGSGDAELDFVLELEADVPGAGAEIELPLFAIDSLTFDTVT